MYGKRDLGGRPPQTMRRRPLARSRPPGHGVLVIATRRIRQSPVHQDVVGRPGRDGVDRQHHGTGKLAKALEARHPARPDAEVLGHPGGGDDADPVDHGVSPRRRENLAPVVKPSMSSLVSPASPIACQAVSIARAPEGPG